MKRNICIEDGLSYVIIETEKEPEKIKDFCYDYVKKITSLDYSWNYNEIGKVLFDTELQNSFLEEPPTATEFYNLSPYYRLFD